MTALHYLFAWANAPFTIAAGVAILFALVQATGILGLLAGDGDHDADVDADADADTAEQDHDIDGEDDHGIGAILFGPLGIGRIPFSLIWQSYAIVFAITGLVLNAHYPIPPIYTLAWTIPISLLTGYGAVTILARALGPIFSSKAQEATSRKELVGQVGVVISSTVSREFGEVRVKDKSGHELRVVCKLAEGERVPAEHEQVVFVEHDDATGLLVAPLNDHN